MVSLTEAEGARGGTARLETTASRAKMMNEIWEILG